MGQTMRVPPSNLDAERSVLGCCMAGARPLSEVMAILKPQDFYQPSHKTVYEAIMSLSANAKPVDILTVSDYLQSSDDLERIGGMPMITALQDSTPLVSHAAYYAKIVREKALLRRLLMAMEEVTALCYTDAEDADKLLDLASQRIYAIREDRDIAGLEVLRDILGRTVNEITELSQGKKKAKGIRTGFPTLDDYLGGLRQGTLTIIAARPAMGKSAFALNIAHNAALLYGGRIAIFSLEMSKEEISYRFIAAQSLVDSRAVSRGDMNAGEWTKISDGVMHLYGAEIYIDDRAAISTMEIMSRGRQLKMEKGGLDMIIIDYLQLMSASGRTESRQQEISEISRTLKVISKELSVPVVALSQLSRAVESRQDKRPMLSDLRESGAIEQDADAVMFLFRPEYYENPEVSKPVEQAEVIVAKNRAGQTGKIDVAWHPSYTLFTEPDRQGHEPPPNYSQPLPDLPFDTPSPETAPPFEVSAASRDDGTGLGFGQAPFEEADWGDGGSLPSDGPFDLNS